VPLALDIRTPIILLLPELDLECLRAYGRKHVSDRQRFLVELLGMSYERRRPHTSDRNADSFDRDFLVKGLRVSPRGAAYGRLLEPFYEFPKGNFGYSKDLGTTKAYRLHGGALRALHAVYRGDEALPVIAYDEDGNQVGLDTLAINGIDRHLRGSLSMPSVLPIPLSQIDGALGKVTGWIERLGETMYLDPAKPGSTTLVEAQRTLYTARKWVVSLGGLPNLYREQSHGRLGPDGFHLITMRSEAARTGRPTQRRFAEGQLRVAIGGPGEGVGTASQNSVLPRNPQTASSSQPRALYGGRFRLLSRIHDILNVLGCPGFKLNRAHPFARIAGQRNGSTM
jgi:hypothetical protein